MERRHGNPRSFGARATRYVDLALLCAAAALAFSACKQATSSTASSSGLSAAWARTETASTDSYGECFFESVATDGSGNVYAAGYFAGTGTYTFASGVTVTGKASGYNALLVKYNSSGTALWAETMSAGSSDNLFWGVTTDSSGNVYLAGYVAGNGSYTFGGLSFYGAYSGGHNAVVIKCGSGGTAAWAVAPGTASDSSEFMGVAVDSSSGYVYTTGFIQGQNEFAFGSNSVTAAYSGLNMVLLQCSTTGTAEWVTTASSEPAESLFNGVAVDSSGNVYAAGYIKGEDKFVFSDEATATGYSSGYNLALVKYNSSGVAQWAQTTSSGDSDSQFQGVTTDSSGDIYAVGFVSGTSTYGFGNSVTAAGIDSNYNFALVKYNSSGEAQWARTPSSAASKSWFYGAATDSSDNVYAVGCLYTSGTYGFGDGVTATSLCSTYNAVLAEYDSSGTAVTAKAASTAPYQDYFHAVATTSSGAIYAAGYIYSTDSYAFGSSATVTGVCYGDNVVLVKYK